MASFEDQIKGVKSRFLERSSDFIGLVVFKIADSIIKMSPVGDPKKWLSSGAFVSLVTKTGRMRKNPKNGKIIFKAPDGYLGGRFRANWDYGFNSIPRSQYDTTDKSGNVSRDRVQSGFNDAFGMHYISNNLEYSQALENGWSRQAPNGMVKLTAMKFRSIMRSALKKSALK